MRITFFALLFTAAVHAQMPALAPIPAGSQPIASNSTTSSFTFVVAGDNRPADPTLGQPPQLGEIASAIAKMNPKPAFALWDGDIVYGKDPTTVALQYPAFLSGILPAGVPVFVAPGNHEGSLKGSTPCPVPGKKHKEKPIDEPDPSGKMIAAYQAAIGAPYGMFRYGNAAFIAVNTDDALDSDYNPGQCGYNGFVSTAQMSALKLTLDSLATDNSIAHIFVFMHRPVNGEKSKDNIGPTSVKQIGKLYKYLSDATDYPKLSVVFASHEHLFYMYDPKGTLGQKGPYTRTDPSSNGPFFIVTGGAGAPLSSSGTGLFFHYLVVNVNNNNVTVTVVPVP
jgi:hypothetical protein